MLADASDSESESTTDNSPTAVYNARPRRPLRAPESVTRQFNAVSLASEHALMAMQTSASRSSLHTDEGSRGLEPSISAGSLSSSAPGETAGGSSGDIAGPGGSAGQLIRSALDETSSVTSNESVWARRQRQRRGTIGAVMQSVSASAVMGHDDGLATLSITPRVALAMSASGSMLKAATHDLTSTNGKSRQRSKSTSVGGLASKNTSASDFESRRMSSLQLQYNNSKHDLSTNSVETMMRRASSAMMSRISSTKTLQEYIENKSACQQAPRAAMRQASAVALLEHAPEDPDFWESIRDSVLTSYDDSVKGCVIMSCKDGVILQILQGPMEALDAALAKPVLPPLTPEDEPSCLTRVGLEVIPERTYATLTVSEFDFDNMGDNRAAQFVVEKLKLVLGLMFRSFRVLELYTQKSVLDRMAEDPEVAALSILTPVVPKIILITDIVNFTTISEMVPLREVMHLVNQFLAVVTAAVKDAGGEINKFIGDCAVVAFPPAAAAAVLQAVIGIQDACVALRRHGAERNSIDQLLYCGIGVTLGEVLEGSVGLTRRDYTLLGSCVDQCKELEGITRKCPYNVLLSSSFCEQLPPDAQRMLVRVQTSEQNWLFGPIFSVTSESAQWTPQAAGEHAAAYLTERTGEAAARAEPQKQHIAALLVQARGNGSALLLLPSPRRPPVGGSFLVNSSTSFPFSFPHEPFSDNDGEPNSGSGAGGSAADSEAACNASAPLPHANTGLLLVPTNDVKSRTSNFSLPGTPKRRPTFEAPPSPQHVVLGLLTTSTGTNLSPPTTPATSREPLLSRCHSAGTLLFKLTRSGSSDNKIGSNRYHFSTTDDEVIPSPDKDAIEQAQRFQRISDASIAQLSHSLRGNPRRLATADVDSDEGDDESQSLLAVSEDLSHRVAPLVFRGANPAHDLSASLNMDKATRRRQQHARRTVDI